MLPAFCINLDRRSDRWDHMSSQFDTHGLVVERVSATDGQDPHVKAQIGSLPAATRLSLGALATFESHRRVWQRLIDSGASHGLVLEDDLVLAPGMSALQKSDWIPEGADLIKLETHGTRIQLARNPFHKIGPGRKLIQLFSFHSATGGYVISARLAKQLLPVSRDSLEPVDDFIFDRASQHSYAIYQMCPAPVVQGASGLARVDDAQWAQTSLTEHWAEGHSDATDRAETPVARVMRRIREEMRALRLGTRYATVPWG